MCWRAQRGLFITSLLPVGIAHTMPRFAPPNTPILVVPLAVERRPVLLLPLRLLAG
jgi:hypothetical protein